MHTTCIRLLCFRSDNLKPVVSNVGPSKACPGPRFGIQNRKWLGIAALVITFAVSGVEAMAQQPAKIPRIGFLSANSRAAMSARAETFQQGLRELGYTEGKNIFIEYQYADRNIERVPGLAAELVRL